MLKHLEPEDRNIACMLLAWAGIAATKLNLDPGKYLQARIALTCILIDADRSQSKIGKLISTVASVIVSLPRDGWFDSEGTRLDNNRKLRDATEKCSPSDLVDALSNFMEFSQGASSEYLEKVRSSFDEEIFPHISVLADHLFEGEGH